MERHNQLLLSAVGDGIYGVDANGCTTFVNQAAEQILGWRKNEITGKKIHDIIHHSHGDGDIYHSQHCPIYASFRDGKVHIIEDEVFWHKSGEAIPVEYTSTPVTDRGELVGAVVIFRDITERKKTQEKLLHALDEIASLKQKLEVENAYLLEELNADFNHHRIIGQSAVLQRLVQQIELVGPTSANVLIIGESGTGKELIARALHESSERKSRPLIKVNCAAIPAELFESEFFGHIKGAFSGAIAERTGRFELADGGTIFLDEIGELPLQLQGKLLRVLQEQQFERVGDSKTRNVDVRVIAATNRDLKQLVEDKKFREDLYFRLNVFPIDSPPLRSRIDDIPMLLTHFVNKVCKKLNQPKPSISMSQMQHLQNYDWPGNIRELENIIERQVILAKGGKLDFSFLAINQPKYNQITPSSISPELMTNHQYQALEVINIKKALKQSKGKIYGDKGAAELLGLKPTTLASKIKKYQISRTI
ncbi:sigma 54-interacting transcriptional regulator [Catenovulum sp. 2E275]|nr:sigma 54-interacting transcriptional regulator [Catenovulum sp. 2E275]